MAVAACSASKPRSPRKTFSYIRVRACVHSSLPSARFRTDAYRVTPTRLPVEARLERVAGTRGGARTPFGCLGSSDGNGRAASTKSGYGNQGNFPVENREFSEHFEPDFNTYKDQLNRIARQRQLVLVNN